MYELIASNWINSGDSFVNNSTISSLSKEIKIYRSTAI